MTDGQISLVDVYRVLTDLQATMTKVVTHLERVDTRNEYADKLHTDFEMRIRGIEATNPAQHQPAVEKLEVRVSMLERFRYTLAGGLALLAIVCSGLGVWIAQALTHH